MMAPKITIAMIICGIVSAAAVGAASAATQDDSVVPTLKVKYDPQSLTTEQGARQLYQRLRNAASEVCPDASGEGRLFPEAVLECRKQALARAVMQINNPRLVAVYQSSMKNG
jgi:UrcA family protein